MPLHLASSAVGAAGWLAVSARLGHRRQLLAWHGPAPAVPRRSGLFWGTAAAAGAMGVAAAVLTPATRERIVPFLPALPRPAALSARMLGVVAAALLGATAAHRRALRRRR
jgi:hypothetical protein